MTKYLAIILQFLLWLLGKFRPKTPPDPKIEERRLWQEKLDDLDKRIKTAKEAMDNALAQVLKDVRTHADEATRTEHDTEREQLSKAYNSLLRERTQHLERHPR